MKNSNPATLLAAQGRRAASSRTRWLQTVACVSIAAMACQAPAHAASAKGEPAAPNAQSGSASADTDAGTILVTARRRSETLLETPVTLSVMTSARLEQLNVKSLQDLQAFTPGLYTQSTSSGRTDRSIDQIIIRGIADALLPTVSVFVDGAPVPTDVIQNLGPEVQRVEVLKGPQSATFGRQTFAGAINIVTRDPGNEWKGSIDASIGSYDMRDIRAAIEIPLIQDKLAMRIGGRYFATNGQYANLAEPGTRLGDQETKSINATIVAKPVDGLKIKIFANYLADNDGPGAGVTASMGATGSKTAANVFNCNAGAAAAGVNNFYCGKVPTYPASQIGVNNVTPQFLSQVIHNSTGALNPIFTAYNEQSGLKRHEFMMNGAIDYQIPGSSVVVSSLTAYDRDTYDVNQDLDGRNTSDVAATATGGETFLNYPDEVLGYQKDFSQELRVTSGSHQRFRWMGGLNYYKGWARSYVAGLYPGVGPLTYVNGALSTTEDKSAFASFAFDFTPQLTLNAEGRYLEETLVAYNRTATSETPLDRSTFHKFVPRVSLQYKPNADMMAYATYSRGINRGGFNLTVLSLTASQRAYLNNLQQVSDVYKPATLDNFELGLKGQLFNHRLTYSLAGFYAKWYDQAFSQNLPVPIDPVNAPTGPSTIVSTTGNSAQSTVRGFELEGGLRASRHLSFTYNVAYSKVTLDHSVQCVQCASITGNTTLPKGATNPAAPSFTAAVGGEYSDDLTGDYKWYVGGDYVHRGRIFTSYENISWIGASDKVNLRAGIRSERIEAMIYVNNVFNNQAYSSVSLNSSLLGGNSVLLGLPVLRTFGAKIGYHF